MRKLIHASLLIVLLTGCNPFSVPEPRFPQFNERAIAGPGNFEFPQWSPDGKHIAFIADTIGNKDLTVYDVETKRSWVAASKVDLIYFDWTPQNRLAYLRFRPDLSGDPFPEILDLHVVDLDSQNDHIVLSKLYGPGNFAWTSDGQKLVALLTMPESHASHDNIYLIDVSAGAMNLLTSQKAQGIDFVSISLASDNVTLMIHGVRTIGGKNQGVVIIYDIDKRRVVQELVPRQIFANVTMGDTGFGWVGQHRWIMATGDVPNGECYNYALYFLSVKNPSDSFCIPSQGIIVAPSLSPDLKQLAFINVVDPGVAYVMLADLPSEDQLKLER